jgi:Ca2+-binding EF-hand superfamily protein
MTMFKVTGADDFEAAAQWAQKSHSLGPKGGRTLSAILQEERESEDEMKRKKKAEELAANEALADSVLHGIFLKLNERRIRAIDLFRKIDTSADGNCSIEEFKAGLTWMGFEASEEEHQALMGRLDKDDSGGVSLKEFDRAIKAVERKRADPENTAKMVARRARDAAIAMKSARSVDESLTFGATSQEDGVSFAKGGTILPHPGRSPRNPLGYIPMHTEPAEPMVAADEIMLKIIRKMNARKYRSIDFFRTMDRDDSGVVTAEEFQIGLRKLGLDSEKQDIDLDVIVKHLDKDGSGDIAGTEFNKAAKMAVKKAKREGRTGELETWGRSPDKSFLSTFSWAQKSLKAHGGSLSERSSRMTSPWVTASLGPRDTFGSHRIGDGSCYDASIVRERVFDSALSGAHPTSLKMPKLPLHKTVYKKAYFDGRFEKEPSAAPHPTMLLGKNRDRCLTATRNKFVPTSYGSVRNFHNTPLMQSSVDQAVFNRDMDCSGEDKWDDHFIALYADRAGVPSWSHSKF